MIQDKHMGTVDQ